MAGIISTLLFIPDISGFTNFVNSTEISHSRHIISELLEIIINSDQIDMTVSEIEGDAVLFYKDEIPSVDDLVKQCEVTFKNFHSHLNRYNTERICRCGACEAASQLSLKFVVHAGEVEKINIKTHQKLHGSDVIIAHRLLKNSIDSPEYILFSENIDLKQTDNQGKSDWVKVKKATQSIEDIGSVSYSYISLKDLHNDMPETNSVSFPLLSSEKISLRNSINAPVDIVYENFTNFEKRLQWNEEIKDIIMHGKSLNKTGSLHTCLVGNNSLDIESIGRLEDNDKIIYGERLNQFKGLRDIISIYTFKKEGDQTIIQTEIDFKIKSFFGKILKHVIRKMMFRKTAAGLQKLKSVSEKETSQKSE